MVPTHVFPYGNDEIRIGWASWDKGTFTERSIKFAYRDASGKVSRGSPELPFEVLADMMDVAVREGELRFPNQPTGAKDVSSMTKSALLDERKAVAARMAQLWSMIAEMPWVPWQTVYDTLGLRYEELKAEIANRP